MRFTEMLSAAWGKNNSLLCVGLDPDPSRLPSVARQNPDALFEFCAATVDATAPFVCAFKPQIAYFSACRAEEALERLITHIHDQHPGIPVILDAKRGDIGPTARQYAREAFTRYQADAVTINPYMGLDSIEPYFDYPEKGVFLLCRTSNPGGSDLQFMESKEGERLFERVARLAADAWNPTGQLGLVVGATFPAEIARVRDIVGDMPLLVPGIGAQGGDVAATVKAGKTADSQGLILNSSRAILYAGEGENRLSSARKAAEETRNEINRWR